jgi:hypothetical protein
LIYGAPLLNLIGDISRTSLFVQPMVKIPFSFGQVVLVCTAPK